MLRRLALLLVLASTSCRREPPPAPAPAPSASAPVAPKPFEVQAPKPPPAVKPPPDRPKLEAKVSTDGEAKRADAATKLDKAYASVEELANAPPAGCDGTIPACRKRFEVFATELAKVRALVARAAVPRCPKSSADELAIAAMTEAQTAWLLRWVDDVEKVGREGFSAPATAWQELTGSAEKTHPRVASSCAN